MSIWRVFREKRRKKRRETNIKEEKDQELTMVDVVGKNINSFSYYIIYFSLFFNW